MKSALKTKHNCADGPTPGSLYKTVKKYPSLLDYKNYIEVYNFFHENTIILNKFSIENCRNIFESKINFEEYILCLSGQKISKKIKIGNGKSASVTYEYNGYKFLYKDKIIIITLGDYGLCLKQIR